MFSTGITRPGGPTGTSVAWTVGAALADKGGSLADTGGSLADTGGSLADTGGSLADTGGSLADTGGSLADTGGSLAVTGGSLSAAPGVGTCVGHGLTVRGVITRPRSEVSDRIQAACATFAMSDHVTPLGGRRLIWAFGRTKQGLLRSRPEPNVSRAVHVPSTRTAIKDAAGGVPHCRPSTFAI